MLTSYRFSSIPSYIKNKGTHFNNTLWPELQNKLIHDTRRGNLHVEIWR